MDAGLKRPSPAGKNDGSGVAGCLGRMRARGTLAWVVCTRVRRSASNAWSRKAAGWSTAWRKMGSTRVSPTRDEHHRHRRSSEWSSREANGDGAATEEATEASPVRPFDHGAIVTSEPTGAPPLIFGGVAATPRRLSETAPRDSRDEKISQISPPPPTTGFRTPRGTHVAMASLASGGGIGSMRTLGGGSPLATVRGAATKYASSGSSRGYSPSSRDKNSEVYSDSESDAEQTGGGDGRRGREATPGFRLYDGLTRADGDDDKENRYDDRYDDRRDEAKTPNESRVAAALASLPPFVGDRYDDRYEGDADRRARSALGDASNAAARAAARTPLGDKSLLRATSQSSLAIIRAASGGTRSTTTTTVTTTVTTRVRGEPPGRGGDTAEAEEETREMELFAALEELVANH
ncbi:predicted protein [Micromonas commoda]|uniref:Uncharacterized protein n=1 Tax=Micromonas commoda (strain RCC299 / NOUM17 / CCMP2709) TaxID=296587 RepID=C1DZ72_MICCC|nr:predicted protein [Micromonas commoda]ACO61558.1 predicted protein [Micromonas commoda]|eukprot:XP_002500300.1 predicted protein [Micromonas commoda]